MLYQWPIENKTKKKNKKKKHTIALKACFVLFLFYCWAGSFHLCFSDIIRCVSFYAYILSAELCPYVFCPFHKIGSKRFLMVAFLLCGFPQLLFIHAEIRTKGNTNIKNSLIQFCDTDKNRTDKVQRMKCTHKRKRSRIRNQVCYTLAYKWAYLHGLIQLQLLFVAFSSKDTSTLNWHRKSGMK